MDVKVGTLLTYVQIDGFFDAGMLLQALKARDEGLDHGDLSKADKVLQRREIGKKLRLSEY